MLFKQNHLWKYQYGMSVMSKVLYSLSNLYYSGLCGDSVSPNTLSCIYWDNSFVP